MKITTGMLTLTHYSDSATNGDNPDLRGTPDRDLFNRKEGYEVVQIIQNVFDEMGLSNKRYIKDLELLIKDKLPSDLRKRDDVKNWLILELKKNKGNQTFRELLSKI